MVLWFYSSIIFKDTPILIDNYEVTCFSLLKISSEGATPNRAVRKGCHIDCYSILRSEGPASIVFVYVLGVALTALLELYHSVLTALTHRPIMCRTFVARSDKLCGLASLHLKYLLSLSKKQDKTNKNI